MRRRALLVGINKYRNPKAELRGCVNDMTHVRKLLEENYGYAPLDITTLLDDQGSASNIRSAFEALVQYVLEGDRAVLWYSGHGTQVYTPDASEADQLAEAIVPWETEFDSLIHDKWFGQLLQKIVARGRQANITLVFDCCHSGTITRDFRMMRPDVEIDAITRNRFFPITEMQKVVLAPLEKIHAKARGFRGIKSIQPGPWDVISACQDEQTAADTYLGGEFRGSLSYALIKTLRETPLLTYAQMETTLKALMKELVPTHTQEVAFEVRNSDQTFLYTRPVRLSDRFGG